MTRGAGERIEYSVIDEFWEIDEHCQELIYRIDQDNRLRTTTAQNMASGQKVVIESHTPTQFSVLNGSPKDVPMVTDLLVVDHPERLEDVIAKDSGILQLDREIVWVTSVNPDRSFNVVRGLGHKW